MPQRFGEEITEEDAYTQAREAAGHMTGDQLRTLPESIAWSPIQKRAVDDELAARGLPARAWTDEQAEQEQQEYRATREGLGLLPDARLAELPDSDSEWSAVQLRALADERSHRAVLREVLDQADREDRADAAELR